MDFNLTREQQMVKKMIKESFDNKEDYIYSGLVQVLRGKPIDKIAEAIIYACNYNDIDLESFMNNLAGGFNR